MSSSRDVLVARIEALCERMDREHDDRKVERQETKEYREQVQAELAALHASTEQTRRRMDKVEPVADMVTSWRARAAGAVMVLGFIGTLFWIGATWFKDEIKAFIFGG